MLNKPINTFASSLDIPVEGATAIESEAEKDTESVEPVQVATAAESKRAPRKSKTEALAALDSHARSLSPSIGDSEFQQEITAKYRNVPPIPVSPTLDMSTVKTASPRNNAITHKAPRPFGLQNCPEYYPTMEEFKDPMEYIRSISNHARQYGICKVIPPAEWTMPFVADTQVCDFPAFTMIATLIQMVDFPFQNPTSTSQLN
jgi:[histone H3]-trimethyl-L-lysine4 demethylase